MKLPSAKRKYQKLILLIVFLSVFLWTGHASNSDAGVDRSQVPAGWETTESGRFSVITYNIAGLPGIISSAVTKRSVSIAQIGTLLNRFDIAHVQEDFNYNRHLYQSNAHAFRTSSKGKIPFGDGLNTLSRFPVHKIQRVAWKDCTGADCFTPKGFSFSRVEVARDVFIDFYNVHANAYNHLAAAAARRKNIRQLSDFIREHSQNHAVIVMGDLNGHYSYSYDNLVGFCTENNLQDVWMGHTRQEDFPFASKDFPDDNILNITDSCETIDKILYRGSRQLQLIPGQYKLESTSFSNKEGLPLSDHHPVSAAFTWRQIRPAGTEPLVVLSKNQ